MWFIKWFNESISLKLIAAMGYILVIPFLVIPFGGLSKTAHVILVAISFLIGIWQLSLARDLYSKRKEAREEENKEL